VAGIGQGLGEARALLFPIDWPEPFGLVMIEAMACGTPVLAFRNGSVAEVIDDGVTGHVVDTMDQAIHALPRTMTLNRHRVRERFEQRFSARRMATEYVKVYRSLTSRACMDRRKADEVPLAPIDAPALGETRDYVD
jgi:glycosyltransferase involved in cell wall biosynthesis